MGFEEEELVLEKKEKRRNRMAIVVTDAATSRIRDVAAFIDFPFEEPI